MRFCFRVKVAEKGVASYNLVRIKEGGVRRG
jgi:hypothetical protein